MNGIEIVLGLPIIIGFLFISYCALLEFAGWMNGVSKTSVAPTRSVALVKVVSGGTGMIANRRSFRNA
jgi:hypothetical protein